MVDTLELEGLIRSELRPQVEQLVERLLPEVIAEVVAQSVNGAGISLERHGSPQEPTQANGEAPESQPKVCRVCGRQDVRFDQGRRVCQGCRSRQQAERDRARDDHEEPHPADPVSKATPSRGRRGSHRRDRDQFWTDRRRQAIEAARHNGLTRELRDGRSYVVVHLPPQSAFPMPAA